MCIKQNNSGIHRAHGLQRLSECNRVMERLWQRDTAKRQMMKLCIFPASISNKLVWYNSSKQCICITNAKNPIHFASAERMGFCLLRLRPKPHVERNLSDCGYAIFPNRCNYLFRMRLYIHAWTGLEKHSHFDGCAAHYLLTYALNML